MTDSSIDTTEPYLRTALVTGSTRGIGRAVAEQLAEQGYRVIVHGRDFQQVQAVTRTLKSPHGESMGIAADLSTREGVSALVGQLPPIDVLVSNAARITPVGEHPFLTTPRQVYEEFMDLHVWPALELAQALLPGMLKRDDHGRLIFTSSEAAAMPQPGIGPYTISKHAMLMLARLCALETKGTTVTSNAILGGPTLTEGVQEILEQAMPGVPDAESVAMSHVYPQNLRGRMLHPVDAARVVSFLASPDSAAFNGAVLPAHGGVVPTVQS